MVALGGEQAPRSNGLHDLYNQNDDPTTTTNEDPGNINKIWELRLRFQDDDLTIAGDLGQVDLVSSVDDRSTVDDERTSVRGSTRTCNRFHVPSG